MFIPNEEIRSEFVTAVKSTKWNAVIDAITASSALLDATLNFDEKTVASRLDNIHAESTSILKYNDENSLSCVITLAYYSARQYYTIIRELPAGKGFADLVFVPLKGVDKPAMVVELKWDRSADTAITQIKEKNYPQALKEYKGNILLVGISYDTVSKQHSCKIEKM